MKTSQDECFRTERSVGEARTLCRAGPPGTMLLGVSLGRRVIVAEILGKPVSNDSGDFAH